MRQNERERIRVRRNMRVLIGSMALGFALVGTRAQPLADLSGGNIQLQNASIHLYERGGLEPVARVSLVNSVTEYERRGFFRIGLLPIEVLEGVTIEVPDAARAARGLARASEWLGTRKATRLEVRRLAVQVSSPTTNRLESGRALPMPGGKWELLDGVSFVSGTNEAHAARGTLQIAGARAGQFVLETAPPQTNSLFADLSFNLRNQDIPNEDKIAPQSRSAAHSPPAGPGANR
jgi:hypothetical protein